MESRFFIYISLVVDSFIAIFKFIAAYFTKSSSMLSEGIHSLIDLSSQLLLIWGIKTSRRSPNSERPFGYGREFYFWSFIVSLVIFSMGGCISFYEGFLRLSRPQMEGNVSWNYAVLAFAFVFNMISMFAALKAFNKHRREVPFWEAVVKTKDPSTIIVLLGDFGDMLGLIVAFLGIFLGRLFNKPYYDGGASMMIGLILIVTSAILIRESKSLLMGETTSRKTVQSIIKLAETDAAVVKVKKHFSTYLSPDEVLLQLNTIFKEDLATHEITDAIERIIKSIKKEFPRVKQIFIEPVAK
ncbi:cation diffusion facilitator family transporter [Mucilaginibacter sp. BT774]|uniref:cation diffusion facilitator family transporter n=1 Tax=Mucilaginibacter sp. BT774 TaxID=3062276 RepID=UPI002674B9FB|nr:cation diffusion facilitator family transporter [Mucilaginibacter sp. BT774]MDO3624649.1 cation diffusion facilitator family transporter [Mucilaginibacter sp. BT774]